MLPNHMVILAKRKLFDYPNVFRLFYSYEILFLIIDPDIFDIPFLKQPNAALQAKRIAVDYKSFVR